jgi:hypothetical protein
MTLSQAEARARFLRQLLSIAEKLPNGLLQRLVEDAQFFQDWNLRKKRARASARLAQSKSQQNQAEEKHWKAYTQRYGR